MTCPTCDKERTKKGHDPCIADLPGVYFACCGHAGAGDFNDNFTGLGIPYISEKGSSLYGQIAIDRMRELGGTPPDMTWSQLDRIYSHTFKTYGMFANGWSLTSGAEHAA